MKYPSFWDNLQKPIIGLAPMDGVTDAPCRTMHGLYGRPDVVITEFTNVEGLWRGSDRIFRDFLYTPAERPVVAQIFGCRPEYFYRAAHVVCELGFDGLDINMGCPASGVMQKGACSGLINNRPLAKEIIDATKEGAAGLIPVSIKTRLGFRVIDFDWIAFVLEQEPSVLTVHARTVSEMSKVPAHWDKLKTVVDMRNAIQSATLVIGNGDVKSLSEAKQKVADAGADGAMIRKRYF